jgi:hypothetical protein
VRRRRRIRSIYNVCVYTRASVGFGADGNLIALRTSAADRNPPMSQNFFQTHKMLCVVGTYYFIIIIIIIIRVTSKRSLYVSWRRCPRVFVRMMGHDETPTIHPLRDTIIKIRKIKTKHIQNTYNIQNFNVCTRFARPSTTLID